MAKYFLEDGVSRDHLRHLVEVLAPRLRDIERSLVIERDDSSVMRRELRVAYGNRACLVEHFYSEEYSPRSDTVEFQVSFLDADQIVIVGESESEADVAEGLAAWILGASRETLAQRAPFAGAAELGSERLYQLAKSQLELATHITRRKAKFENEHTVRFEKQERGCEVLFWNSIAEMTFLWGETPLFTDRLSSQEIERILELVRGWVDDAKAPSEMRAHWPHLKMGKAADFFEAGKVVEGEFFVSWDNIVPEGWMWENTEVGRLQPLIERLRELGFDHRLLARRSGPALKLLRSRRGWRSGEPFVKIELFGWPASRLLVRFDVHEDPPRCGFRTYDEWSVNPELLEILEKLASLPLVEGAPLKRIPAASFRRLTRILSQPLPGEETHVTPASTDPLGCVQLPEQRFAEGERFEGNAKFREISGLLTTSPRLLGEKLKEISPACEECVDLTIPFMAIYMLVFSAASNPEKTKSIAKLAGKPEMTLLEDIVALPMFQGILVIDKDAQVLSFAENFSVSERMKLSDFVASESGGM
ncbi:hypothetical protein LOC68_15555 [Blastopirellula sp. JC732]|uniref:Uncharacterized protein n=1 Tax=Blastopirellula sediminis TaxID=2894196 RepID=A0A9X1MP61_9BACT|nr:hypothetical protein [Blastopirellula sediminis]MCC9606899.1 hypothetical protein [Blastopirellula sediminis]MCC9629805.1 hypothetical protein [Blastopirellula sediminis]